MFYLRSASYPASKILGKHGKHCLQVLYCGCLRRPCSSDATEEPTEESSLPTEPTEGLTEEPTVGIETKFKGVFKMRIDLCGKAYSN
jgi:hypothetical protein